ncbi:MAG: UDP-N-acetylmuramoyl-L-alanine--D-glutamate ligase [Myxococcota bacterium]
MDLTGRRMLVVGLGVSGLAAVRLLASRGAQVIANDARTEADLGERAMAARAAGAELALGGHDPALFSSVDHIVVSPGVPKLDALDAAERAGVPIAGEVELASWFFEGGTVVAVTGTNGKSTVTALVGDMCRRTGRPTFVGGNLGTPLVEAVGTDAVKPGGFVVIELSSYQLERVDRFRADVSVLLNVSEDHLDRHASFAEYAAAKGRIFHGQSRRDAAVVPSHDELCRSLARAGAASLHCFGTPDGEVRVAAERIVNGHSSLSIPVTDLAIRGAHNLDNACAAALSARLAGVPAEAIAASLRSFRGLPHRMQSVGEVAGVEYLDDSKATNVGAAVAAIDGLADRGGRVVLIAGGVDKGGSYAPLRERMDRHGRALILLGEAASRIEQAFEGTALAVEHASSMQDAVRLAHALAQRGDAVLLAPACASFDMYPSYAHRGDAFQQAVHALREEATR